MKCLLILNCLFVNKRVDLNLKPNKKATNISRFFMFRMNGMSRCHGWQEATNVQDERYVAVPWMARSNECSAINPLSVAALRLKMY
ncbi:MAG: hypothetical protein ACJAXS_001056 [Colwellia sp.]|jgi:hypothetical protein